MDTLVAVWKRASRGRFTGCDYEECEGEGVEEEGHREWMWAGSQRVFKGRLV